MDILRSLSSIATEYAVFEENQVLTDNQLNSVVNYLSDQNRLTRVNLLGVGTVCGLRVSVESGTVKLTRGVGITTDGDLICIGGDGVFDKYKAYDESQPKYAPFFRDGVMIRVYELVPAVLDDERAAPLVKFESQEARKLSDMVALLLMESYEKDRDICTGTACDNLGKDCLNNVRLLLVDKSAAGALQQLLDIPGRCFAALGEIAADRPVITPDVKYYGQFVQAYRDACDSITGKLVNQLPIIYKTCSGFLKDVLSEDPTPRWTKLLKELNRDFSLNPAGIQYYYDFLKDVVETFNDFRDLLFGGDLALCCPATDAFPKHLLLGDLVPGADTNENRTPFFPSPLTSHTREQVNHARFLAGKLDALIMTFDRAASGKGIRITPSMFEDRPLEERAIPYYYRADASGKLPAIQEHWSYHHHVRGMDGYNYSYNAQEWKAEGAAADPLSSHIGRFPFFRIEGHLGQPVADAEKAIETEIKKRNLPFTVRSVMIGVDRTKLIRRPGIRYTDLDRFHYLLRQDLARQLRGVKSFSTTFRTKVDTAESSIKDSLENGGGATVSYVAAEKDAAVQRNADDAIQRVDAPYSVFKADTKWRESVADAMTAAGEFKANLGKFVKTEFTTPFDSFIGSTHIDWLDMVDSIVRDRDTKEDDKLVFSTLLSQHPGMEHFAGARRGGTFVLMYAETSNAVVGDMALPYYVPDPIEAEPTEPPIVIPGIKPGWILDNGLKLQPSLKQHIDDLKATVIPDLIATHLDDFKTEVVNPLGTTVNSIRTQMDEEKAEYFKLVSDALGYSRAPAPGTTSAGGFTDAALGYLVEDVKVRTAEAEHARAEAEQPGLTTEEKTAREAAAQEAEKALASSVNSTMTYMHTKGTDVSPGTEGMAALMELNTAVNTMKTETATKEVSATLTKVQAESTNVGLRMAAGAMRSMTG